jgi:hypothetical protein
MEEGYMSIISGERQTVVVRRRGDSRRGAIIGNREIRRARIGKIPIKDQRSKGHNAESDGSGDKVHREAGQTATDRCRCCPL